MRHLLLFHRISRGSKDVATAKEHGAGDAAIERLEERELALFERELCVATVQLDAIGGVNFVERCGIDAESAQLIVDLADSFLRCRDFHSQQTTEPEESDPELHVRV